MKLKIAFASLIILLSQCGIPVRKLSLYETQPEHLRSIEANGEEALKVKFYGTGCHLISYGDAHVFTDPFLSNPNLLSVLFGRVKSKPKILDPMLDELREVDAVLVGHAHYDHLLDLPYTSKAIPESAVILGSETMRNILKANPVPQKTIAVDSRVGNIDNPGEWFYSTSRNLRIMPLHACHLPHTKRVHFAKGDITEPLEKLPGRFNKWLEGMTISFLIDFFDPTDSGTIAKRVFFQSSGCGYPTGLFPKALLNEKKVDFAILSMGSTALMEAPLGKDLEFIDPEVVSLCHWENFFRSRNRRPLALKRAELNETMRILTEKFGDEMRIVAPIQDAIIYH